MSSNLKLLSEKYHIPENQKYQIRYADGTVSQALTLDEISDLILNQKLTGQEEVSIYPQENFKKISKDPLFYDLLLSLLDSDLTPVQRNDITRVLTQVLPESQEIPEAFHKKKRGVTPSIIVPKPEREVPAAQKPIETQTPTPIKKKRSFFKGLLFLLLFIVIGLVVFRVMQTPQKIESVKVVTPQIEYVVVELPPEEVSILDAMKSKNYFEKAQTTYINDTIRAYKEAVQYLHSALKSYPKDPDVLSLLAKCYLYLWEMSRKDDSFLSPIKILIDRSMQIDPLHVQTQQALSMWYLRKKNYEKASEIIREVLKNSSLDGESYLTQGEIFYETAQYDDSIASLEKALEANPALTRCHYLLGKAYLMKGNPEKAYEIFGIGLNLYPEHSLSRLESALIEIQTLNQLAKAQGNLKIVTQFPSLVTPWDLAKAHYYMGWIYEEDKQIDFAIKEYKKAFDLDPLNELYASAYKKYGAPSSQEPADLNIKEESLYFVNIGNKYLDENRVVDAIAQYMAAIQVDPKNYLAHFQLGIVSEKQKKWKEALSHYNEAISAKGNYVDAYAAIAKIHIRYFDYAKAIQFIEKVKSLSPRSAFIYSLSGFFYLQKGDLEKSISEYKKATELDSDNFEALFQLGSLFRLQRDFKKSESYFFKALKLKPEEPKIQTEVAQLYFEQGLKSQALEHLKKFTQTYPLNISYQNGLAKLYYMGKNYAFAKEAYLKALSIEDQNLEALEGLAQTYDALEQYREALDSYKKMTKIDPSDSKWYFERGKIQFKTGNLDNALTEFKLTYQINENYPLAHYFAGRILIAQSKADAAKSELKKEIKINPHLKDPLIVLANLLAQDGQYEEAQANYKAYIQLDPSNSDAYFNLGKIHQLQNRFETAIEFFKMALEKNPDRGDAYLNMGLIYKHLERKSDAIDALENYLRVSPDAENITDVKKTIEELKRY